MQEKLQVGVFIGDDLAHYGFGDSHPFSRKRMNYFWEEACRTGLHSKIEVLPPQTTKREVIEYFHDSHYVSQVIKQSKTGIGFLDDGDTPAFIGVYEAAATVVGSVVHGIHLIMSGKNSKIFSPIAGLHHARRDRASGFCVFNDCGVAIEILRKKYGIKRVLYVDIDAHHGDGVYYAFESDPDLFFIDFHEDGRYLYPGTGKSSESGKHTAHGTKLNIPLAPGSNDEQFNLLWPKAEEFMRQCNPEFILLQGGADCLAGDPITHLEFSSEVHKSVTQRLCAIAGEYCEGRLLAMGGGGYNANNIAQAWCAILSALVNQNTV